MKIKINIGKLDFHPGNVIKFIFIRHGHHVVFDNMIEEKNISNRINNQYKVYLHKLLYQEIIKMMITGKHLSYYIVFDDLNINFNDCMRY